MSYEQKILEYIQQNEPTTRKEILEEFYSLAPKTVYQNVNKLIEKKKIHQSELKTLTINEDIPQWKVPAALTLGQNYSDICNAFAKQNPAFLKMVQELSQKAPSKTATLLADLTIILNILVNDKQEQLAKKFKFTRKVDVHELENNFKRLAELISLYHEGVILNENKN